MYYDIRNDILVDNDYAMESMASIKTLAMKALDICRKLVENVMLSIAKMISNTKDNDKVLYASPKFITIMTNMQNYVGLFDKISTELLFRDKKSDVDIKSFFEEITGSDIEVSVKQNGNASIKVSVGKVKVTAIAFMSSLKKLRRQLFTARTPSFLESIPVERKEAFMSNIKDIYKYVGALYKSFFSIIIKTLFGKEDITEEDISITI